LKPFYDKSITDDKEDCDCDSEFGRTPPTAGDEDEIKQQNQKRL
jgi:hypothetical protein